MSLIAFFLPLTVFAYEIKIKGFIAADILNLEQIKQEEEKADRSFHSGIGVLDLKLYGRFDKLESKIKLDLDSGSLAQRYNLFEEATLAYRVLPKLKIKMGKGLVPFHRKHWGVLKHSYRDSGSELNPEHSWRDQDRKMLLSLIYGSYRSGLINSFTLWGNSSRPKYEENGELKFIGKEGSKSRRLSYDTNISFNTSDEQGFANKLELFFNRSHSFSLAGIAYNSKWSPHWSYALDTSYRYRNSKREIWFEYTYGIFGTHWGAKYAVQRNREHLVQLGIDQYLNSRFNIVANTEYAKVDKQNHSADLGNTRNNDGLLHKVDTFKIETGLKLKFSGRSGHLTFGVFYEQKNKVSGGIRQPKRSAMQLANTLAFWFLKGDCEIQAKDFYFVVGTFFVECFVSL